MYNYNLFIDDVCRSFGAPPPEPFSTPPDQPFITASCGHEVYNNEFLYIQDDGDSLCPDCIDSEFNSLSTADKADLLGCSPVQVSL